MSIIWIWTVELESGVWLAPWKGDPGRTLVRGNAKEFASHGAAEAALAGARKYRPFSQAVIVSTDFSLGRPEGSIGPEPLKPVVAGSTRRARL